MKTVSSVLSPLFLLAACLLVNTAAIAAAAQGIVRAEQWELGRSGARIVQLPALKELVNNWLNRSATDSAVKIELQYPGGEEGELWVQELADWLVALGVPSQSIVIAPGSGADDRIKLSLVNAP